MTITDEIKARVDIVRLIEVDLPLKKAGKNFVGCCPFHAEDTPSFTVFPDTQSWHCFGACGVGGDCFTWMERKHGLSFVQALEHFKHELNVTDSGQQQPIERKPRQQPAIRVAQPPDDLWQEMARAVIDRAQEILWSPQGADALAYLRGPERGLLKATIRDAQLGLIPGGPFESYIKHLSDGRKITIPCGISIPWIVDGAIWGIKVRRLNGGKPKYQMVTGSECAHGLYWADDVIGGWPVLFVEGEFDTLIVWQEAQDLVCPVTLGSGNATLNARWFPVIAPSPRMLTLLDPDATGASGTKKLAEIAPRARQIVLPSGKDPTEYHNIAGMRGLYIWLESVLSQLTERSAA